MMVDASGCAASRSPHRLACIGQPTLSLHVLQTSFARRSRRVPQPNISACFCFCGEDILYELQATSKKDKRR